MVGSNVAPDRLSRMALQLRDAQPAEADDADEMYEGDIILPHSKVMQMEQVTSFYGESIKMLRKL